MDQEISVHTQEIQGLELRAVAVERDRDNLNSQLEERRAATTLLEQRLSDRAQEVQSLDLRAATAEEEAESLKT